MYRIREERWLGESHLSPYALGFGYHVLSCFTRDASPVPEPSLLREPQLPQDSAEPDRCTVWARP